MGNPFYNRGPILEPRCYLPRPRETREVLRLLAGSQNCSLVGPMKSGKTSLLLHLARSGTMAGQGLTPARRSAVYLSFEGLGRVSQEQFFHLMLLEMAKQTSGKMALVWQRLGARDGISFLELREALDQLQVAGERLVFLLDEVELAPRNPAFDLNFFSALRHIAARPDVCFVTATSCRLHELAVAGREIGSPFADLFSVVRLRSSDSAEAWRWIRALAAESGAELEPERGFIAGLGGGFPYHLQLVAYEAFECKHGSGSEALTEDQRLYVASRAYEHAEPIMAMMWERLGEPQREAALASLGDQTAVEVDGFTWLEKGRAVVVDGLVWRFLSDRHRDRGLATADVLDPASPDRAMMYGLVRVLMRAMDARDRYSRSHAEQVARLAAAIARELGCPEELTEGVRVASRLHDIGRISISDLILLKPGPLTEVEMEIMRTHPLVGAQILDAIEFPWAVKPAVRYHHERLDGSGYPEGLAGEEIPLSARIVAVADVMSAMTSDRPYHRAATEQEALAELVANAGVMYDAAAVDALARVMERGTL